MWRATAAASLPALLALAAGCASAREDGARGPSWEDRDRVHFTLVPAAWRASASGDALVKGVPATFDEGGESEETFGGRIEGYSDRVGIFLTGFHTSVADTVAGTEADARYGVYDLGVAMRVAGEDPWVAPKDRKAFDVEVDALVLLRGHFLHVETNPQGAFAPTTDDGAWGDVVGGVRAGVTLFGRATLFGRIDGGGLSTGSYRSWSRNGEAGIHLRFTENLGAVAAYRWFRAHVEGRSTRTAGSTLDIRLDGPWVGIVLLF
jgi:hypothetical protein